MNRAPDETPTECEVCEQIDIDSAYSHHPRDLHARIRELEGSALETERDGLRARCEALAESVANSENWTGDPARKEERASFLADLRAALDGERKP